NSEFVDLERAMHYFCYAMLSHIPLQRPLKISAWRKISLNTWKLTGDSSVYGLIELPVDELENHLQKLPMKISMTHVAGCVIARCMQEVPEINSLIRWGKLYPRKTVDVFFQVASDDSGENLTGHVVRNAAQKTLGEITSELKQG